MFADVLAAGNGRLVSMAGEDTTRPFFYWLPFGFGELRRGHLVLWNPYTYAGTPFFGGFGPALLYPPNWLHMLLPTAIAINVSVTLHVFLAGVFVYLWAMHRRLHPAACVLAGLVFMFGGAVFLQIYRGHLHCLTTLVWAPLIFLAIDGVLDGSPRSSLLGIAAVAMQILAGHVQYTFYTGIVAGLYALLCWLAAGCRPRDALALLAIYAGGACLAGVQLLTGLQIAAESHRTRIGYDLAAWLGFPPENILTAVLPEVFGNLDAAPYWGRGTLTEMSLFMGVAPFVLMIAGIVHGERRAKRFALVMTLVVLVLAWGDYTPLFHVLYDHVPGFGSFRGTTKFIFLAALFMAMLAAVGFDVLLRRQTAPRWLGIASLGAGGALLWLGTRLAADCRAGGSALWLPALGRQFFPDAYQMFVIDGGPSSTIACSATASSFLVGGATFALVGSILLASRRFPRLLYGLALLGALEVMNYAHSVRPSFDPTPLPRRSAALRAALDARQAGDARVASRDPYSYAAMGAGAFDLWGAEPAVLGRYTEFVKLTQGWPLDALLVAPGFRKLHPLLGMLRLRYQLDFQDERPILEPTRLAELPRAVLVPSWRVTTEPEALLHAMDTPGFDPRREALLEHDPGLPPPEDGTSDVGTVTVTDVSTEVLEVRAETRTSAILVITDNYSASWSAVPWDAADDRTYRVVPADHTLRAIPLPAGTHHLRVEYRPSLLGLGAWLSVGSLAVYVVALIAMPRRSSPR
jgi:hypothetical protein